MRRHKLVKDILIHADTLNANKGTILFLLATMSDKALTKFYEEFMSKC